ncbi:hypothetical protein Tco_0950563 [Tanacetum coccineum]
MHICMYNAVDLKLAEITDAIVRVKKLCAGLEKPRIVQMNPEVDKKTNESLIRLSLKDCPYRVMWIPSGYMKTELEAIAK